MVPYTNGNLCTVTIQNQNMTLSYTPSYTTPLHSLSRPQLREIPQWILYYAEIQSHVQHTIYQFKEI